MTRSPGSARLSPAAGVLPAVELCELLGPCERLGSGELLGAPAPGDSAPEPALGDGDSPHATQTPAAARTASEQSDVCFTPFHARAAPANHELFSWVAEKLAIVAIALPRLLVPA
jgi:hypothetical protein